MQGVTAVTTMIAPSFQLKPHQQRTVDFIITHPFAGIWLDMGGGKSLAVLAALQQIQPIGHILVIAPINIARSTWIDEIEKWDMPVRTKSLIVNASDKKLSRSKRLEAYQQVFSDPPSMYFVNQELVSDLVENMPVRTINGNPTRIWPFQTVIIDEAQAFKSHSASRFQALASVRPAITRLIELSGTPAPNGTHDLWAQVYLLDQGASLGHNITAFRDRWFTPKMAPGTTVPSKWTPNNGAEPEIYAAISHLVMSAKNTSLSLPEIDIVDSYVELDDDLLDEYKQFKRDLVLTVVNDDAAAAATQAFDTWWTTSDDDQAKVIRQRLATLTDDAYLRAYQGYHDDLIDNFAIQIDKRFASTVIAQNQAVLTSKLMQFASGTLYTGDPDEPSTKGEYTVLHDEKITRVIELINQHSPEPVLLAYHFRSDREQLLAKLAAAGIQAEPFDGSRAMVARWNAKQIPVMIVHPASAGHGLNLQAGGSTMIWYTLPFSLEHYLQTNKRLHRPGQLNDVTIYRILTRGTQDERLPVVLDDKQRTQDNLLRAVDINNISLAVLEAEVLDDLSDLWTSDRL